MKKPSGDVPGHLLYKCRLCGKIEKYEHSNDLWDHIFALMQGHDFDSSFLTKSRTHICDDGKIGVVDLVGGVPDN